MRILKTLVLVFLLILKTTSLNATGENNNSPVSYGDIPEWFAQGGVIGISDPTSDTLQAYNQAVTRALAFYSISKNMELSSVYEYYYLNTNEVRSHHENQKSHWIADSYSSLSNYSYSVIKTHRTKNNETIVLLRVLDDASENKKMEIEVSFMYHYENLDDRDDYGEKQILSIYNSDDVNNLGWISTIDNSRNNKISSIDTTVYKMKNYNCTYTNLGKVDEDMVFSATNYGLWNGYLDTFFQALSVFESKNVLIKNTTRQITNEYNGAFGDKSQNIARLVMKTNVSCSLVDVSLNNNKLYANWEIIEK